jgi:small subunit ribosomal protein S18
MAPRPQKKLFSRTKVCRFCADKELLINYKDVKTLRNFVSERGKIIPRRIVGTCATHQRQLCEAVKQARQIAFLPYSGSTQG